MIERKLRPSSIDALNNILSYDSIYTSCIVTFDFYEEGVQVTEGVLVQQRDRFIVHVSTTTHATKMPIGIYITDGIGRYTEFKDKRVNLKKLRELFVNGNEINKLEWER